MSFSKIVILGNLTDDPEHRVTPSGQELTSFSIAVNTYMGQGKEPNVAYYRCTMWGKRGSVVEKYVAKGQPLLVSGQLTVRSYAAKDGTQRQSLEVNVDDFSLIGNRGGNSSDAGKGAGSNNASANSDDASANTTTANIDEPIDLSDIPF